MKNTPTSASRPPPKVAEPIIHKSIKYSAPWDKIGFIEARDISNNDLLWDLKIYGIEYDPNLEKDVQEIYITSLKLNSGNLEISTEANAKYIVNLETKEINEI